MIKKYSIKLYDSNGDFKTSSGQADNYAFDQVLNSGLGNFVLELPVKFNESISVNHNDRIELWVQDNEGAVQVYGGYIYKISRVLSSGIERVSVYALGYGSRLALTPDMITAPSPSHRVIRNSFTLSDAVRDIVDKYQEVTGKTDIYYTAESIQDTTNEISYTFIDKNCLESIEIVRGIAGGTWFWKVGVDGLLTFKQFSTDIEHLLTLGREIQTISIEEDSDDIINYYHLWNGLQEEDLGILTKTFYNQDSIDQYGIRFDNKTDGRIRDEDYFDDLGTLYTQSNSVLSRRITLVVSDNTFGKGYDIERIDVGDTIRIVNNKLEELYDGTLIVTAKRYEPTKVVLNVQINQSITGIKLEDLRKSLNNQTYADGINTTELIPT